MTQKEINEGNKLIAEFIGFEYNRSLPAHGGGVLMTLTIEDCRYHSSWDWLMPVVEKITGLKYKTDNENVFDNSDTAHLRTFGMKNEAGEFMVRFNRFGLFCSPQLINATWLAVVAFIKWYKANP